MMKRARRTESILEVATRTKPCLWLVAALLALLPSRPGAGAEKVATVQFHQTIQPILKEFCYDCHGDGAKKGGVTFDEWKSDADILESLRP